MKLGTSLDNIGAFGAIVDGGRRAGAKLGPQRQCGIAIRQGGQRLGTRTPAPLLGEHSAAVLQKHAGVSADEFATLVDTGIVSLAPKPARNLL